VAGSCEGVARHCFRVSTGENRVAVYSVVVCGHDDG